MKKLTFSVIALCLMLITAVAQKGYVNPAANYCEMLGYRYEIDSEKSGAQVGKVHLPDGSIVNAWDFYRGKVAQEFSYPAKMGYDVETEVINENGAILERAVAVKKSKGVEERIPLLDFMKMNGDELIAEVDRRSPTIQDIATVDPNFTTAKSLPSSFDWRNYNGHSYIGGVRDQGDCGSCFSFGACASAEGVYNYATGSYDGNVVDFAEAYILWCIGKASPYSSHLFNCDGADYDYYELLALTDNNWGAIPESYFPYSDASNQSCASSASNAPKTIFKSWHRVPSSDVDGIKTAIMTYGVVDAAVNVTNSFENYSSGIWSDSNNSCSNGANTTTNHSIALVGWGTDPTKGDYWILRNSWGTSWGENGYMRISVNSAAVDCAVAYVVYEDVAQAPVAAFSASPTTVITGNSVNFTDQSTNSPTSWSWTFEGGTPATSTNQNVTVTYNTPGTYDVTLVVANDEGNDTETKTGYITVTDQIISYCASASNNASDEWIAGVQIGTFSKTSGSAKYSDFTSSTINLTAGQAYDITLTPGFAGTTYNEYWKIWIDLNHDGDFDDANENVFDQGGTSKTAVTGTITIPSETGAVTTRMRVSMKYNGAPTACENTFSYGEVEDYTVSISGGDTEAPTAPTNLAASNIGMTSLDLNWNASTDNVAVTGYDVYQNGSYLASTTSTSYSVAGLNSGTSFSYYVIAKDAVGNKSSASNTVNVTTTTDTEAPTVPTNLSSSNITNSSVDLSWNASTDNVGVAGYDLYKDGTFLATTTSTSYNVSGLSAATTYAFYVIAKDAAGNKSSASSSLNVTTANIVVTYCTSKGNSTSYEWIDVVGLNDLYNETGNDGGYKDYTNLKANVSTGSSYTLSLSAGFSNRSYREYWKVWIDYDVDGTFDSDEVVASGSTSDGGMFTSTVNIPSTASIGQTRMRVSMNYNATPTACESFSYGEVEDYTVNISANATPVARSISGQQLLSDKVFVNDLNVYPNPAKESLTISVPFENAIVNIINTNGATIKTVVLDGMESTLSISDIPSGVYIISIPDEKGPMISRFVKQ